MFALWSGSNAYLPTENTTAVNRCSLSAYMSQELLKRLCQKMTAVPASVAISLDGITQDASIWECQELNTVFLLKWFLSGTFPFISPPTQRHSTTKCSF